MEYLLIPLILTTSLLTVLLLTPLTYPPLRILRKRVRRWRRYLTTTVRLTVVLLILLLTLCWSQVRVQLSWSTVEVRPLAVILLDTSDSMREELPQAKLIVRDLTHYLLTWGVETHLIIFSDHVISSYSVRSSVEVEEVLRHVVPGGGTMYTYPLLTALSLGVERPEIIIIVSDGLLADLDLLRRVVVKFWRDDVQLILVCLSRSGLERAREVTELLHGKLLTPQDLWLLPQVLSSYVTVTRGVAVVRKYFTEVPLTTVLLYPLLITYLITSYLEKRYCF